ncbi:MAG: type IX secretion system PorP/SprF family membrane protein [Crocinitomix sp.]|jgi:type IX secretion system PorP/SprF family membrane protein
MNAMRIRTEKIILLLGLMVSFYGNAQQTSLNTLYNQNVYLINPAAAGLDNCFSAYLNHRNQWVGINDSPVRNVLTVDGRLFGAHGIGLDTRMNQAGLLRNFNIKLTYAYHLQIAEKAKLSFGLSFGMIQQSFAFSNAIVTDYTDNTLGTGNQSDIGFSSDAGLLLSTQKLKFGISIPQVFARGLNTNVSGEPSQYKLVQHMIVYGAYDVVQKDKWTVTPSLLYKNAAFIGHQMDIAVRGSWKNTIGLGAMYRTAYGVIGMVDLNLKEKFKLAYGYGFGGSNLTGLSSGSHEIMLGIKLCCKAKPIVEDDIVEEVIQDTIVEVIEAPIKEEVIDTVVVEIIEPIKKQLDVDSLNQAFQVAGKILTYELNSTSEVNSNNESKVVNEVYAILADNPDIDVLVIGHTCDLGSTEKNQEISKKRAMDIRAQLLKKGIDPNRIRIQFKGEAQPRVPNISDANRRKNRRVAFTFSRR